MCVYMLASAVQPLAKPKSQSLIMGGRSSPSSDLSSSVLSSLRSLSRANQLWRQKRYCATAIPLISGWPGQLVATRAPRQGKGFMPRWHCFLRNAHLCATLCTWQYSTADMNCCTPKASSQSAQTGGCAKTLHLQVF